MADEQQTSTAVLEPQTTTTETPKSDDPGYNVEAAHAAAQAFLDSKNEPETAPSRQRDENGKFVGQKTDVSEPAVAADVASATSVDPAWLEAARAEGVSESILSSLKSDADVQTTIAAQRFQTLQRLGIDPQEYVAFRQSRQQDQKQQTQQQPQPVPALEDFKLEISEDDLAPEVAAQLKGMADYVNKLKASMPDSQALKAEVDALKGILQQQSAVASHMQAQTENARVWDNVAPKVSGYVDHFGKPSELLTNSDPNSEKMREVQLFNALYFEPAWQKYSMLDDRNPRKLELALRDAWGAYPLSKAGDRNGKQQNGALGNGSVVRTGNSRTPIGEAPLSDSGNLDVELERSLQHASSVWDNLGGNPFKHSGAPLA